MYCNNSLQPKLDVLALIAKLLDVDVVELIESTKTKIK
jgi:hypothetical protein